MKLMSLSALRNGFLLLLAMFQASTFSAIAQPVVADEGGDLSQTEPGLAYLSALCTLTGEWSGRFDQYRDGAIYNSVPIGASFKCLPERNVLMETNTIAFGDGEISSLKVIFPDKKTPDVQMSYFHSGLEAVYFFETSVLKMNHDKDWEVLRSSSERAHPTDPSPPISRYFHIRDGDTLTMLREVRDGPEETWRLSSKFVLTPNYQGRATANEG